MWSNANKALTWPIIPIIRPYWARYLSSLGRALYKPCFWLFLIFPHQLCAESFNDPANLGSTSFKTFLLYNIKLPHALHFHKKLICSCRPFQSKKRTLLGNASMKKKTFSFGYCPNCGGGGLPMPEIFGPLFRSAFLVNKKSLFLQKCQCIELLTVF